MIILDEKIASNDAAVILSWDGDHDYVRLRFNHVCADVQPSSLLTAYLSADGVNFDEGHTYINDGFVGWFGEPNPQWWPQPIAVGQPQSLNLGCRLGIDVGERPYLGMNGVAEFVAMGTLNGQNVSPTYTSLCHAGFVGGAAGVSPRPSHSGGGYWFPGSPVGTPFDWAASVFFAGHRAAPGARIRGIKLSMNGGGTFGRLIKQGYFRAESYEAATTPSPVPSPSYTVIGNLSGGAWAFDGTTSKSSGGGSCSWKAPATSTWVGKAWASPWQPSQIKVYASSDAGFVLNVNPQVTVSAYWSDTLPAHETDGTLIGSQTITDANSAMVTFTPPGAPHAYHWIVVSHAGTATSMYVAQAVIG